MSTLFFMKNVDVACRVFDAFIMAEALSEEERIKVLMKFVESGEVQAVSTSATKEEVVKALSEHLNILNYKRRL